MRVGQRRWWVLGGICLLLCVGFILAANYFGWSVTGVLFLNKTLWDWLQLLIVPLALAIIALLFQLANTRTERQIAKQHYEQDQQIALDKQREDLLQAYLDRMAELLLEKNLRTSPSDEVRNVARTRTITVLTQLDARRVSYVFAFLREAGLISTQSKNDIVSLDSADFHGVQWSQADLSHVNLGGTDLHEANLSGADLRGANLRNSILSLADLSQTNLESADLSNTELIGANLSRAYLMHTDFSNAELVGANLSKAYLRSTNFRGADFLDASLSEADLYNAEFSGTGITKKQLAQANVKTTL